MEAGREEGRAPSLRPAAWRADTVRAEAPGEEVAAERRRPGRESGSKRTERRSPDAGGEVGHAGWCSNIGWCVGAPAPRGRAGLGVLENSLPGWLQIRTVGR